MRPLLQCIRLSCLLFVYLLLPQPSQGAILLRVEQVGGDVQVSGSGSAITTDLIHAGSSFSWTSALTDAQIYALVDDATAAADYFDSALVRKFGGRTWLGEPGDYVDA